MLLTWVSPDDCLVERLGGMMVSGSRTGFKILDKMDALIQTDVQVNESR